MTRPCLVLALGYLALGMLPAAAQGIAVRVGDHAGYSRVVFDLPPETKANVVVEGGRILVVMPGTLAAMPPATLPRNVRNLATAPGSATLDLVPGAGARPVRIGDRMVIDVLDPAPTYRGTGGRPERPRLPDPKPALLPPAPLIPDLPAEPTMAATPATEPLGAPAGTARVIPVAASPIVAQAIAARVAPDPPAPIPTVPDAVAAAPLAIPQAALVIKADGETAAAAFRRGGFALIVLDRRLPPQTLPDGGTWTTGVLSTTIQLPLAAGEAMRLARNDTGWTIERATPPAEPRELAIAGGDTPTFAVPRPGRAVAVLDPVSHATILVGTSKDAAPGQPGGRRTPAYALVPTWQGLAVEPSSDAVELRATTAGFTLVGGTPLPAAPTEVLTRTFDVPSEPSGELMNRLRALEQSTAAAPPRARTRHRLASAETLLALGLGPEAQSMIQTTLAEDPQAAIDARIASLSAIAALASGRRDETASLDDPRLPESDELNAWRTLRDRRLGRGDASTAGLARAVALARAYPATLRRLIWPELAEAAIDAGLPLEGSDLPPFLVARQLQQSGKIEEAITGLDRVAAGPDGAYRVRAAARAAELRLAAGRITAAEAADIMERLAVAWRGDGAELGFVIRAAELRAASGQWRAALESLRAAEKTFPDELEQLRKAKGSVMQGFLTAEGNGLSALDLVVLAADFAEAVPEGEPGRLVARLLADKLAALDLPARSIPVLRGLMEKTVAGPARAELGSRLASLLLEGADPAGARTALEASETPGLSASLAETRLLLRARVQAAEGDVRAAVDTLAGSGSADADDLRARLLVKAGDWPAALAALDGLAAKRLPAEGKLDERAQDILIRQAEAATGARDAARLRKLAAAAPRLSEPRAEIFSLLTSAPLESGKDLSRSRAELAQARDLSRRLQAAKVP